MMYPWKARERSCVPAAYRSLIRAVLFVATCGLSACGNGQTELQESSEVAVPGIPREEARDYAGELAGIDREIELLGTMWSAGPGNGV